MISLLSGAVWTLDLRTVGASFSGVAGAVGGSIEKPPYDLVLRYVLQFVIFAANFAGGIIVAIATLRGLYSYASGLIAKDGGEVPKDAIRLSLGRSLALALEFQLGADIMGTALDPSLTDIVTLASIVVLRTVLNYFLGRELDAEAKRPASSAVADRRDDRSLQ